MNILAFEPYAQREGHFGVYAAQICQELALLDHRVTLVTTELDPKLYLSSPPKFDLVTTGPSAFLSFRKRGSPIEGLIRGLALILDNFRALFQLLRIARKLPFDAVHFFDYEPISTVCLLWLFSRFSRTRLSPLFVVVHAPDPSFQGHANIPYHLYSRLSRPLLRKLILGYAKAVTAHGTWPPGELEKRLGLKEDTPRVIPLPYGTVVQEKPPSREEARRALGLKYHGPLLLFFGMLRKDKGVEFLIEAMSRTTRDCKLLLAGMPYDWDADAVHQMIRLHRCEDKVLSVFQYIPEQEISNYFAAADVLILPYRSHYMGAAGPLKTAFGFGLPVIATRVRDLAYHLDTARIGIAAAPDNVDSLKDAIEQFLSLSPSQREEMAKNSRRLAERCSWAVVAKRFSEIYRSYAESGEFNR